MGDTSHDPIDHARTTRQHAGETMKNGVNAPGLVTMAVGVVALVVGLASFASGNVSTGAVCAGIAVLAWIVGGSWLWLTHRRVRQQELRWAEHNPHAEAQPPTS